MNMPKHASFKFNFYLSDAAADPPFAWRCGVMAATGQPVKDVLVSSIMGSEDSLDEMLAKIHEAK